MRLTINLLDNRADNPGLFSLGFGSPDYEVIEGHQFVGERVVLDNRQFHQCTFQGCNMIYAGGPFGFSDCDVGSNCGLSLTGGAARGHALWKLIQEPWMRRSPV
jgi:hypothetical protein